eukprot:1419924-Amphidinium_carterae.1
MSCAARGRWLSISADPQASWHGTTDAVHAYLQQPVPKRELSDNDRARTIPAERRGGVQVRGCLAPPL